MKLKLIKFQGRGHMVVLLKDPDMEEAFTEKWKLGDVKEIEDQTAYAILSKYKGHFKDVTNGEEPETKPGKGGRGGGKKPAAPTPGAPTPPVGAQVNGDSSSAGSPPDGAPVVQ